MIKIRSISDSDKHFATAIQEYLKRLGTEIQIINYKSSKKDNPAQIIQEDTIAIVEKLQQEKEKGSYVVLLSKDGAMRNTSQRKDLVARTKNESQNLIFLIGGPYGFDESILRRYCMLSLSFGAITMPHGLVKLVVLEQIYRCYQIIASRSYHY